MSSTSKSLVVAFILLSIFFVTGCSRINDTQESNHDYPLEQNLFFVQVNHIISKPENSAVRVPILVFKNDEGISPDTCKFYFEDNELTILDVFEAEGFTEYLLQTVYLEIPLEKLKYEINEVRVECGNEMDGVYNIGSVYFNPIVDCSGDHLNVGQKHTAVSSDNSYVLRFENISEKPLILRTIDFGKWMSVELDESLNPGEKFEREFEFDFGQNPALINPVVSYIYEDEVYKYIAPETFLGVFRLDDTHLEIAKELGSKKD